MKLGDYPFLFTVIDRFSISGRGVILARGVPWKGAPVVRRGDPLILRTPLGDIIKTEVRDLEMISYRGPGEIPPNPATPVLLPKNFHKFDIPLGTEVFHGISRVETPARPEPEGSLA